MLFVLVFSFQVYLLIFSREINASLQDTTAVSMCGYFNAVFADSVIHKLLVGKGESMQTLLNDMVAIDVLDQSHHVWRQSLNGLLNLLQKVRLHAFFTVSVYTKKLACSGSVKNSIIFCTARVPCIFKEMVIIALATCSTICVLWLSVQYSISFWQR